MCWAVDRAVVELYAVVEGVSEQNFVEQILAEPFARRGIYISATRVGKPGHKSGIGPWERARKDILNFLRQGKPGRPVYVTTMFDFYRMPHTWPRRADAATMAAPQKAVLVEDALLKDVASHFPEMNLERFIPYVQVHEYEALLFSSTETLISEFPDRAREINALIKQTGDAEPESINDGPSTAPSKRIEALIPEYAGRKPSASVNVLREIGIDTIRHRCPHFDSWLFRLESLSPAHDD